jgi:hypothetical protein
MPVVVAVVAISVHVPSPAPTPAPVPRAVKVAQTDECTVLVVLFDLFQETRLDKEDGIRLAQVAAGHSVRQDRK